MSTCQHLSCHVNIMPGQRGAGADGLPVCAARPPAEGDGLQHEGQVRRGQPAQQEQVRQAIVDCVNKNILVY